MTESFFRKRKDLYMRQRGLIAVTALLLFASAGLRAADDGAALYKKRCAGCHGAGGEGKPAVKAPALKGTSMEAAQIEQHLTQGEPNSKPPHNKGMSGLKPEQAKAIAEYVKTL
jgi:mono/diheme cytochrome c family protein